MWRRGSSAASKSLRCSLAPTRQAAAAGGGGGGGASRWSNGKLIPEAHGHGHGQGQDALHFPKAAHALFSSVADPLPPSSADDAPAEAEAVHVDMDKLVSLLQDRPDHQLPSSSSSTSSSLEASLDLMFSGVDHPQESLLLDLLLRHSPSRPKFIGLLNWAVARGKLHAALTPGLLDALPRLLHDATTASPLWDFTKQLAAQFDVVPSKVRTFNNYITCFSRLGRADDVFEVYTKIVELGSVPDSDSYYLAIVGLCKASSFDKACSVCQRMLDLNALPESPDKLGHIVRSLCKGGKAVLAQSVNVQARANSKHLPFPDVCKLIASLSRDDQTVASATGVLDCLSQRNRKMAIKPFSLVVRGLCRIGDVGAAKELLSRMIAEGPPPGNDIFNRIIAAYSRNGDMEAAVETMKLMETRGLKPDVYTYTLIMSGYARGGLMEEACEILSLAKLSHSKLTPVTYHTLIRGYCKLEQFDKALELLAEMNDFGVTPNADEYNKLVQSLCLKSTDWKTSEKLLKEMQENGLHLNSITRGLITAVKELEEESGNEQVAGIPA